MREWMEMSTVLKRVMGESAGIKTLSLVGWKQGLGSWWLDIIL
jgi:hypothetical protein